MNEGLRNHEIDQPWAWGVVEPHEALGMLRRTASYEELVRAALSLNPQELRAALVFVIDDERDKESIVVAKSRFGVR